MIVNTSECWAFSTCFPGEPLDISDAEHLQCPFRQWEIYSGLVMCFQFCLCMGKTEQRGYMISICIRTQGLVGVGQVEEGKCCE